MILRVHHQIVLPPPRCVSSPEFDPSINILSSAILRRLHPQAAAEKMWLTVCVKTPTVTSVDLSQNACCSGWEVPGTATRHVKARECDLWNRVVGTTQHDQTVLFYIHESFHGSQKLFRTENCTPSTLSFLEVLSTLHSRLSGAQTPLTCSVAHSTRSNYLQKYVVRYWTAQNGTT